MKKKHVGVDIFQYLKSQKSEKYERKKLQELPRNMISRLSGLKSVFKAFRGLHVFYTILIEV